MIYNQLKIYSIQIQEKAVYSGRIPLSFYQYFFPLHSSEAFRFAKYVKHRRADMISGIKHTFHTIYSIILQKIKKVQKNLEKTAVQ